MFGFLGKRHAKVGWHPDFRIVELLPDIKVVRTKFIVNIISIVVFVLLLVPVSYREIVKIGLKQSIRDYQEEIDNRQSSNRKLTSMSDEFSKLSEKLEDIKKFKEKPLNLIEMIMEISEARNANIIYDLISYRDTWDGQSKTEIHTIRLQGNGRTTADIGDLKTRLSSLKVAENYTIQIAEVGNPTKDPTTGIFSFAILVTISEAKDASR